MGILKRLQRRSAPRINISLGRKINVGNYESLDLHVSFSRDVDPGESVEEAFDSVFLEVIKQLDDKKQQWGIDFDQRFETIAHKRLMAKREIEKMESEAD
jgi:hypothetical protein